jgi:tRNA(Arg) A34 adenosine deaminase TadA|uniref:CMP/dCMP-type deaminase domain-containing protein n=1 Tax=viral metagenome TaxID=1070528 RepID=A0A6C0D0R5_9ZZZZ
MSQNTQKGQFCVNYDTVTNINALPNTRNYPGTVPEKLPTKPLFGYIQPWNEYCPKCTLDDQKACKNVPCQTHNIKSGPIYNGIEVGCNPWMTMACEEALISVQNGGGPFGAVILRIDNDTGKVLEYWKNHNHVELWSDPTAHAEVTTIRVACSDLSRRLGKPVFDLSEIIDRNGKKSHCVIFSSAEPCPMCFSAIAWARITTLIFAATRFDAAQQGVDFSDEAIYDELKRSYKDRKLVKVYQASCKNSLDAFNLWARMKKVPY